MKVETKVLTSVGELIPDEELPYPMPVIGKELMLFKEFHKGKLMEFEDRKQISNLQRKGFKLFLFSSVVALAINRGITLAKISSFDFMNMNFVLRLSIRTAAFGGCMYVLFYIPLLKHLFEFRDVLNKKYLPRYSKFLKSGDILSMNAKILDDPELTQEEYSHYVQMIESAKLNLNLPRKNV